MLRLVSTPNLLNELLLLADKRRQCSLPLPTFLDSMTGLASFSPGSCAVAELIIMRLGFGILGILRRTTRIWRQISMLLPTSHAKESVRYYPERRRRFQSSTRPARCTGVGHFSSDWLSRQRRLTQLHAVAGGSRRAVGPGAVQTWLSRLWPDGGAGAFTSSS